MKPTKSGAFLSVFNYSHVILSSQQILGRIFSKFSLRNNHSQRFLRRVDPRSARNVLCKRAWPLVTTVLIPDDMRLRSVFFLE